LGTRSKGDKYPGFKPPFRKPAVHLICNAHLDPVWQWRWEEGASEALATFRTAAEILNEHGGLIFCHNEAVLYRWVERFDPALFDEIRKLVGMGRWVVSGGWFLQPDVNLPGTESVIRQIAEGRLYFEEKFGGRPRVAYNFDSFGHGGGLPQILKLAGFGMYIHMRPQADELELPADLYRWRGVDGAEIAAYRIAVGLYHTERGNIEERLKSGVDLALRLGRDVPVFWGLGNHGGGATRKDLEKIDAFIAREERVRVLHSSPDKFYEAVKRAAEDAPVFEGDLQRTFTGCYTSLSRLKRRSQRSLGRLVQAETLASTAWRLKGQTYPEAELREAWRGHLFNDFHDILTGSCIEPAERDALDLYGRVEDSARRVSLGAAATLNDARGKGPALPVTVLNTNPSLTRVPVEFEGMADYRPFWKGRRHMGLFRSDGRETACQEEQPEALLPFNDWRRKICFMADLPGVGAARYYLQALKGKARCRNAKAVLRFQFDKSNGLISSLQAAPGAECLAGFLFEPLVIEDDADSWGTGRSSYLKIAGRFRLASGPAVIQRGAVRTITQSIFEFEKSRIVMDVCAYPDWPVLEFKLRITWNEEKRRLKLSIPTVFDRTDILCEVPGGAIRRPADGQEHVHGRWLFLEGLVKDRDIGLGIVNSGQPGFDFHGGKIGLSVLRSAAYCHERGFKIEAGGPARKFADIGVHEVQLLVTVGKARDVREILPGLADWLSAPPAVYAHLPFGEYTSVYEPLLSLTPKHVRLLACKRSWDGKALIVRLQEAAGFKTRAVLKLFAPERRYSLAFNPFEIKTIRIEPDGRWGKADLIDEIKR
jgi:alpha-mannosidase